MKSNQENKKVLEGFYHYIGSHHVENTAKLMDDITKEAENTIYPTELDSWFNEYTDNLKRRERNRKFQRSLKKVIKRVAIFIFIVISGIVLMTISVDAFRIRLFNIITEVREKYTEINIKERDENQVEEHGITWASYFYPERIPDGYSLSNSQNFGEIKIIYFTNDLGDTIEFSQSPVNSSFQVDTENAKTEEIEINSVNGLLVEKDGILTLIWVTDSNTFYIMGKLNKDNIKSMAESIKSVNK